MLQKYDISELLNAFLRNLDLTAEQNNTLINAREQIRATIRNSMLNVIFSMQGSYKYETIIKPNKPPHQQMDLDDGVYIPEDILESFSCLGVKPVFNLFEKSLIRVARKNHWQIKTNKPTCIRVNLDRTKHIDLPIYLIKDNYESKKEFLLAHRKSGWIPSDPIQVEKWISTCEQRFGCSFKIICRILKAWRDNKWEDSPWKSICLMTMIARALEELEQDTGSIKGIAPSYLLLDCVILLNKNINKSVPDPTDSEKMLDENVTKEERDRTQRLLERLEKCLCSVMFIKAQRVHKIQILRNQFGKFFPVNFFLIKKYDNL